MKNKLLLWGSALALTFNTAFAQQNFSKQTNEIPQVQCRTTEANKVLGEGGSEVPKSASRAQAPDTYRIPVVFHVYGTNFNGYSVNKAIIDEALLRVNNDFNGLNDDFNTVDANFEPIKSTLNVSFELAKFDENGESTNGIVTYPAKSGYGNGTGYDDAIAADAWDNTKYMNIYIQNDLYADGGTTSSGVAWYPRDDMTARNTARVVYNGAYLANNNTSREFSSVLTHEFGHFLNLIHTFGDRSNGEKTPGINWDDDNCERGDGDDQVDDTPPTTTGRGCNATNCAGELINGENYMDYNVTCYKMFTQGQVSRMTDALQTNARRTLWTDQNVIETLDGGDYALALSKLYIKEGLLNDGSFDNENGIDISLNSDASVTKMTFTKNVGTTLVEGTDYEVSNLPNGLSPVIVVKTETSVSVTLSGSANEHATANNTDFDIEFLAPSLNLNKDLLYKSKKNILITFRDEYQVIHRVLNPALDNKPADKADKTFYIDNNLKATSDFYTWAEADLLEFGSAMGDDRQILGTIEPGTSGTGTLTFVGMLDKGVTVGPNDKDEKEWLYSNINDNNYRYHSVYKEGEYEDWAGKTKFAGISFLDKGERYFGWIKIAVSADGSTVSIKEVAYYNKPDGSIVTGFVGTKVVASTNGFNEDENLNDGTLKSITFTVTETAFSKSSGNLTLGTDYTVENIPTGYDLTLTATSNTTVVATLTGVTTNHESYHSVDGLKINFTDAAFATLLAKDIAGTDKTLSINYIDEYRLIYTKPNHSIFTDYNNKVDVIFALDENIIESQFGIWSEVGLLELYVGTGQAMWGTNQPGTSGDDIYTLVTMLDEGVTVGDDEQLNSGNEWTISNQNDQPIKEGYYYHTLYKDLNAPDTRAPIAHTAWAGKTKFAGLRFTNKGKTHYGWVRINIGTDLETITIIDYAYHTKPNEPVVTGFIQATVEKEIDFIEVGITSNTYNSTENNLDLISGEYNSNISGKLTKDTHFSVTGLPNGIDIELEKVSEIRLVAKAIITDFSSVNEGDLFENIVIDLKDAAFEGISASTVGGSKIGGLSINIVGEYKIIHGDDVVDGSLEPSDKTATKDAASNFRKWFFSKNMDQGLENKNGHGIWYNGTSFEVDAYGGSLIADDNKNVTLLAKDALIGDDSKWVQGGDYQNLHHVTNATYTTWNGKTGYAGFQFTIAERVHYGWAQFKVAANGSTVEIVDYAYYDKPGATIKAGQTEIEKVVQDQTITFILQETATANDIDITLTATATSGLDVIYVSSDEAVVKVNGSVLEIIGEGTATVTASQAGNDDFNAATPVTQSITVTNDTPLGINNLNSLTVHPNPVENQLHIEGVEIVSVEVVNLLGKVVVTSKNNIVDVSSLHSGCYIVNITTPAGRIAKRIIKK